MRYLLLCTTLLASPAFAETADSDGDNTTDIVVTAQRLNAAREKIDPSIGAQASTFEHTDLEIQPGGIDRGIAGVLLQAPGVSMDNDGDGEVHIRNEHGNVLYRLNGINIPQAFHGFGSLVDPRVAETVEVLTGALPAQYGFRTTGVVNLTTRKEAFDADGDVGIYGGSNGSIIPSFTLRGRLGRLNYFLSGSYQQTDQGLANPEPTRSAIHDQSKTWRGFGYLSYILGDSDRVSVFGGSALAKVQLPNQTGVTPEYVLNGRSTFDSATLDQNQRQDAWFGVVSWQHSTDNFNLQAAAFTRYAKAHYLPDPQGGTLIFNGTESDLTQQSQASGIQIDSSLKLGDDHTLRAGLFFQQDISRSNSINRVFPATITVDPVTLERIVVQSSDVPIVVPVNERLIGRDWSAYIQDEWKLGEALTLNAGLRFDHSQGQVSESQLSPRVGLVWTPDNATTLHLGYARYFTPPPLTLIGQSTLSAFAGTTGAPAITIANPIRSQREHLFDVGLQHQFDGRLTVGVDVYYKIARNLLDDAELGTLRIDSPFNYAKAHNWGVELSASYAKGPLHLYGNVARGEQKAKDIVSNQFLFDPGEVAYIQNHYIFTDHSQKWTASGGIQLNINDGIGKLQPALDFIYGSGLRAEDPAGIVPNGGTQQSYFVANFGIAQTIGGEEHGWSLRFDVINLFDKVYLEADGSGVGAGQPVYGPRRGFFVGLRKSF
ncbi:MAG: TonB-dependent receptor [Novosphingobium sp.]